jgi:hypothetical protein
MNRYNSLYEKDDDDRQIVLQKKLHNHEPLRCGLWVGVSE